MKFRLISFLLLLAITQPGWAADKKKHKNKNKHKIEEKKLLPVIETDTDDNDDEDETLNYNEKEKLHIPMEDMRHSYSVSLPMNRNGSGTGWNPDKTPMYKYNIYTRKWLFFFHGDVFLRFNSLDFGNQGSRSVNELDVRDYIAFSGHRKSGLDGLFHFNAAFSTDAIFRDGFGQLFQHANRWNGTTISDRQHPNNILSELSASYAYSFADKADFFFYGGYPAEPALGPVSYLKRPSSAFNTDAPLSHSLTDATYISYGVGTFGLRVHKFKIEASTFTGRQPDMNNINLNLPYFNSWSSRLSFNPTSRWAVQVSRGFIASPNVLQPATDITRTTASATYVRSIAPREYFSYTLLWGQNETNAQLQSNAALVEATRRKKKLVTFGRYEWVQKTAGDLNLNPFMYLPNQQYNIHALTLGGSFDLLPVKYFMIAAGAQVTGHLTDAALNNAYGEYPVSGQVYLHLMPILQ